MVVCLQKKVTWHRPVESAAKRFYGSGQGFYGVSGVGVMYLRWWNLRALGWWNTPALACDQIGGQKPLDSSSTLDGEGWGDSFDVCLSATKADAVIGPSTPASSLLQKKAAYTTPTIQAVIRNVPKLSSTYHLSETHCAD